MHRRVPKRGFHNKWAVEYTIVNIGTLENLPAGTVVDLAYAEEHGLCKHVKNSAGLKVLGKGELTKALTVKAAKFSASAKEAIEKAGGKAETAE